MKEVATLAWGGFCGAVLGLFLGAITVGPLALLIDGTIWPYVYGLVILLCAVMGALERRDTI